MEALNVTYSTRLNDQMGFFYGDGENGMKGRGDIDPELENNEWEIESSITG